MTREELLFVRGHAARRVGQIPIAEFVNAFYVGERVLWEAALGSARNDESRRAALVFATHLPRYFEVATTHAAEVYIEAEERLAATGERIRRDLLEDLVAGIPVLAGPRMDAARAAGLEPGARCLVVSSAATPAPGDESLLRSAATALARAVGGVLAPLTVVRHGKVDMVARAPDRGADGVRQRLERAQRRLQDGGLPLAIGVSTVVGGPDQIADAYREAELARASLGPSPGVVALTGMSAFDYLTLGAIHRTPPHPGVRSRRSWTTTCAAAGCSSPRCASTSPPTSTPAAPPSACTSTSTPPTTGWARSPSAPAAICTASRISSRS